MININPVSLFKNSAPRSSSMPSSVCSNQTSFFNPRPLAVQLSEGGQKLQKKARNEIIKGVVKNVIKNGVQKINDGVNIVFTPADYLTDKAVDLVLPPGKTQKYVKAGLRVTSRTAAGAGLGSFYGPAGMITGGTIGFLIGIYNEMAAKKHFQNQVSDREKLEKIINRSLPAPVAPGPAIPASEVQGLVADPKFLEYLKNKDVEGMTSILFGLISGPEISPETAHNLAQKWAGEIIRNYEIEKGFSGLAGVSGQ